MADLVLLGIFIFFFLSGWQKGFLKTILGPLTLIGCSIVSIIYFNQTKNVIVSLLIGLLGPLACTIFFAICSKTFKILVDLNDEPNFLSRLIGGILNLFWGGGLTAIFIVLLMFLPSNIPYLSKAQSAIRSSIFYSIIYKPADDVFSKEGFENPLALLLVQDEKKLLEFSKTPEYQNIVSDERVQSILSDPETAQQIQNKQLEKLLTNPKIIELIQDEKFVQKMMDVYAKLLEGSKPAEEELSEQSLTPNM